MKLDQIQVLHHTAQIVKPYDPSMVPTPTQDSTSQNTYLPFVGAAALVLVVMFLSVHFLRRRKRRYRH